jgi:hypothetical protein
LKKKEFILDLEKIDFSDIEKIGKKEFNPDLENLDFWER